MEPAIRVARDSLSLPRGPSASPTRRRPSRLEPRENEKEVGESVEIGDDVEVHRLRFRQPDDRPLRPPTNGARHVQCSGAGLSTREDERTELRQLLVRLVDPALHHDHPLEGEYRRLGARPVPAGRGCGQLGAECEQVVLDRREPLSDRPVRHLRQGPAEDGVQLVRTSVGLHARVALADSAAPEERGPALVAGARIDLHRLRTPGSTHRSLVSLRMFCAFSRREIAWSAEAPSSGVRSARTSSRTSR